MNTGIFDTEHFETATTLARLISYYGHKVSIIATAEVSAEMEARKAPGNMFVLKPSITNVVTLVQICREEDIRVLILNSVTRHHFLIAQIKKALPKVKLVLTIHDAGEIEIPSPSKNFRDKLRQHGKSSLVKEADAFIVLLEEMKPLLDSLNKPVIVLPGRIFEKEQIEEKEIFRITIPGSIDLRRRNYQEVVSLASILSTFSVPTELEILGAPVSDVERELLNSIDKHKSSNLKVLTYNKHLSSPFYDSRLLAANLLWAPLQPHFNAREEYGRTKATGVYFDAIAFAKPLLIPASLPIPEALEGILIPYSSHQDILNLINSENLKFHQEKASTKARSFTPERYASSLKELLQDGS